MDISFREFKKKSIKSWIGAPDVIYYNKTYWILKDAPILSAIVPKV